MWTLELRPDLTFQPRDVFERCTYRRALSIIVLHLHVLPHATMLDGKCHSPSLSVFLSQFGVLPKWPT